MAAVESYDYVVVNHQGKLDEATQQINCIIVAERSRVHRRVVNL
jgi:guanylate kinase